MTVKEFTLESVQLQVENMVNVKLELKKINNTTIEFKGNNILVIVNKNDDRVKAKRKCGNFELVGSIEHERGVAV